MENLELKYVCPYLPYGLKIYEGKSIYDVTGIYYSGVNPCDFWFKVDSTNIWYKNVKPILRGVCDLRLKSSDGIIPIVELAKLDTGISDGWRLGDYGAVNDDERLKFYYSGGKFVIYDKIDDLTVSNHLELYQKLFEWHFDVFDLHSKGLCVYESEINKSK